MGQKQLKINNWMGRLEGKKKKSKITYTNNAYIQDKQT
jgi:hypothetical protein